MADDELEILAILTGPAPRDVDGDTGALHEFNTGFADGWHGRVKLKRNGIYSRAYENGRRAKTDSTYFEKRIDRMTDMTDN
jgi:hypothetical protein